MDNLPEHFPKALQQVLLSKIFFLGLQLQAAILGDFYWKIKRNLSMKRRNHKNLTHEISLLLSQLLTFSSLKLFVSAPLSQYCKCSIVRRKKLLGNVQDIPNAWYRSCKMVHDQGLAKRKEFFVTYTLNKLIMRNATCAYFLRSMRSRSWLHISVRWNVVSWGHRKNWRFLKHVIEFGVVTSRSRELHALWKFWF